MIPIDWKTVQLMYDWPVHEQMYLIIRDEFEVENLRS